jgi:tRNA A37 N6-isopentenylltransferase MiaA
VTNKLTEEEMCGIPHHCLGFLPRNHSTFTVLDFCKVAEGIILDILSRGSKLDGFSKFILTIRVGKCPIVVGGTHYYVETLLWGTVGTETRYSFIFIF